MIELRWAIPPDSVDQRPVLQYRQTLKISGMTIASPWTTVPTVVVDDKLENI